MATPKHKNPLRGGDKTDNFGRRYLPHHYYIPSLSDLFSAIDKKNFKEIRYFCQMTYVTMPYHKNPCPGGHEIYNFGRPFLGHYHFLFRLSDPR